MATALQHIENHWNSTVVPSILEQYKDSEKWQSMLKAVIDQMQIAEDAAIELTTVLDFKSEIPTGGRLDFIAGLVNVKRMAGESDSSFYTRFVVSLGYRRSGTPDFIINSARLISGAIAPQYMDEVAATFFVYTGPVPSTQTRQPILTENGDEILTEGGDAIETEAVEWDHGGSQLSRAQVRKLSPAGVLGLPGAAIRFADGSFLGDTNGKIILAVADDDPSDKYVEVPIVTSDGKQIVTDEGKRIVASIKL